MSGRGMLTKEVGEKYGIVQKELRLIPYLQYLIVNHLPVDPAKIDGEERHILAKWKQEGKIDFSMSHPCSCTKDFWDFMHNVMWDGGYAIHLGEDSEGG